MKRIALCTALVLSLAGGLLAVELPASAAKTPHHPTAKKVVIVRGPRGPRGPRGRMGLQGLTGATGPAGQNALADATVVSTTMSVASSATATTTLTATCPSGERAVGGGATSSDTTSSLNYIDFTYPDSISSSVAQAWSSVVYNDTTTTVSFTAYAICA